MNALKHGLSAQTVVLPGEDPRELSRLCEDVATDLRPRGALEREMLARIVGLLWRLRRAARAEAALWERDDDAVIDRVAKKRAVNQMAPGCVPSTSLDLPDRKDGPAFFADQFREHKPSAVERMGVHEQRLDRALHAALRRLELLRAARGADEDRDAEDLEDAPDEVIDATVQNEPTAPAAPDAPPAPDDEARRVKPPMESARGAPELEDAEVAEASGVENPDPSVRMPSAALHCGDLRTVGPAPYLAHPGTPARDGIAQNEPTAPSAPTSVPEVSGPS
jgi:hypothetical protein